MKYQDTTAGTWSGSADDGFGGDRAAIRPGVRERAFNRLPGVGLFAPSAFDVVT